MAAVPPLCSCCCCPTLVRYNNRVRFVSSSFIYKRSARPRSTVNFRKRYRTVRPSFHSAPATPVLPHQPLQPAYISTRKWIAIIKASLSQSFPFASVSFSSTSQPSSPPCLLHLLSLSVVFRQLVEILSTRNNFTTTVATITTIVTVTPPPLPSHIRVLFSVLKLHRCGKSTASHDQRGPRAETRVGDGLFLLGKTRENTTNLNP